MENTNHSLLVEKYSPNVLDNYGGNKNPVLLEHYGDILFKLNKVEDALIQWELAVKFSIEPSFELLNKIENAK